jgi:GNAT superfamily N-acetyltransferase
VGFRHGTNSELAGLHAVESEVEAERHPDSAPQPLDSYIAFARNLPSQFADHTWLVEEGEGAPVASAACWSDAAGDHRVMECYVFVRRTRRRQGIGAHLLGVVSSECESESRPIMIWSTFDTVPAGEAFSRRFGARVARVNRTSELQMADVGWGMVACWVQDGPRRAPGYGLEVVDGPFPPKLRADAARFHQIMQTAPRDHLEIGDVTLNASHIVELDTALVEAGRQRWTILVRDPSGSCVGGTEVTFEPWQPTTVQQQNTGIAPSHRGLGLAKWAKAAMLERIRDERPQVQRVLTGNAYSNEPMLAINNALGFKLINTRTEWQADVAALRRTMDDRSTGLGDVSPYGA